MILKDLAISLNDNMKITNIRWKSKSMEISTDGGKTYRRPTYYETVNLYTTDLCSCDGSSDGGNIDTSKLKEEIKKEIINDDSFKAEIAKLVDVSGGGSVDTDTIEANVKKAIESDDNFVAIIATKAAYNDTDIKNELKNKVDTTALTETLKSYAKSEDVNQWIVDKITEVVAGAPEKFDTLKEIADWIENDTTNATKMSNDIADLKSKNESVEKELESVVKTTDLDSIKSDISDGIKSDATFKAEIAKSVDTSTIKTEVESNIKDDTEFKNSIAGLVTVDSDAIKSGVKTDLKADSDFKSDIAKLVTVKTPEVNTSEIETNVKKSIKEDAEFKKSIVDSVSGSIDTDQIQSNIEADIKADSTFKTDIAKLVDVPTADDVSDSVKTKLESDETFKSEVSKLVTVDTDSIKSGVETDLKADKEFKNSLKGEKGEDGKSIKSLDKDENNNIIVTFSDNTTQNIGKLNIDISADFLTDNGFGNIRFNNSKFQYYDSASSTWVDINITDSNKFIVNLVPQNMKNIYLDLDKLSKSIKLKFTEPNDTIVDGQLLCYIAGIKIVRKLGSEPESETDGDLILDLKRSDFGKYINNPYLDSSIEYTMDNNYFYKFFPYSNSGVINNSKENYRSITIKNYSLFGFKIDQSESDPDNMITYIAENTNYNPVKMNFDTKSFDYGDWADAWFIKNLKPCMLKYDGTVDYYLNPNDYTKKENGEDSDISNSSYEGNAMIQFPKVYYKIIDNSDNTADIYISDKKLDDNYHCWSHIDNNGNEIDYCYISIFNGSLEDDKIRSLSGKTPITKYAFSDAIKKAEANNLSDDKIWSANLISDRMLINLLLLLIAKTTNIYKVFGNGNIQSFNSENDNGELASGTMNDKGLFYGTNANNISGVKVFGMEHWWGNVSQNVLGYVYDGTSQKIKLTYNTADGSKCTGYNASGENYIAIENSKLDVSSGVYNFIDKMFFTKYGLFPKSASGSATTYYDSYFVLGSSNKFTPVLGVNSNSGSKSSVTGIFSMAFNSIDVSIDINTSICCKPLLKEDK